MVWKKGESGNPRGRVKNPEVERFREALIKVEGEARIPIYEFAIRKAYKDNDILKEILKKLLPDLTHMYSDMEVKLDHGERVNEIIADIISRLPGKRADGSGSQGGGSPSA